MTHVESGNRNCKNNSLIFEKKYQLKRKHLLFAYVVMVSINYKKHKYYGNQSKISR